MDLTPYKAFESKILYLKVLCLHAYSLTECPPAIIEKFARERDIPKRLKSIKSPTTFPTETLLVRFRFDWKTREMVCMIPPMHCIPLYVYMLTYHRDWLKNLPCFFLERRKIICFCR